MLGRLRINKEYWSISVTLLEPYLSHLVLYTHMQYPDYLCFVNNPNIAWLQRCVHLILRMCRPLCLFVGIVFSKKFSYLDCIWWLVSLFQIGWIFVFSCMTLCVVYLLYFPCPGWSCIEWGTVMDIHLTDEASSQGSQANMGTDCLS